MSDRGYSPEADILLRCWRNMESAPKDGTVIMGSFPDPRPNAQGTNRLIRWVKTPYYEGWDTGPLIQPVAWCIP